MTDNETMVQDLVNAYLWQALSANELVQRLTREMEKKDATIKRLEEPAPEKIRRGYLVTDDLYSFSLSQDGKTIHFRMYSMDESKRNTGTIAEKNGIRIYSAYGPQISIDGGMLYIQGEDRDRDEVCATHKFPTVKKATFFYDTLCELFDELNKKKKPEKRWCKVKNKVYNFILEQVGNSVAFKMHSMDESKRQVGCIIKRNGYQICSSNVPQILLPNTLFIGGAISAMDGREVSRVFGTTKDAAEFWENIKVMFDELNDQFQCCGHPKSSIVGEGLTHWCEECDKEVPW